MSAVAIIVPSPLAGEGGSLLPRAMMGEGWIAKTPHPIGVRGRTIVPSPARGEGTRAESRAFWRNEPNESHAVVPAKAGTHTPVFGYGSRLSARFAGRRPGRRSFIRRKAGTTIFHKEKEEATCGCRNGGRLLINRHLQGAVRPERVSRKRPSAYLFPARRFFGGGLYTMASSFMPSGSVK
jgi:hypothetical protein